MTHGAFEIDDESVPAAPFTQPEVVDSDDDAVDDDLLAGEGDGGFSDTDRLVRVWLEDGRLVKVRVSPVWFTRIRPKDRLENHFREALSFAVLDRAAREREAPTSEPVGPMQELAALPDEIREVFESIGPLSRELLAAVDTVHSELSSRTDAAIAAAADHETRTVVGRSQGVRVTLDAVGNTREVTFDERWLDRAQVGSIATHVQLAADRAYAQFVPTAPDEAVAAAFEEQRLLSTVLTAILNPRSER